MSSTPHCYEVAEVVATFLTHRRVTRHASTLAASKRDGQKKLTGKSVDFLWLRSVIPQAIPGTHISLQSEIISF